MESRTSEEQITTSDPINALPPEMQLYLFNFLSSRELTRMQACSTYYHGLLNDNLFWRQNYARHHGAIPFENDAKNQYIAAALTIKACNNRHDTKQAQMQYANRFLAHHKEKPWSYAYRGASFFYGAGIKKDTERGFDLILEGFNKKDHRAAFYLAKLLIDAKISDPTFFNQLITKLGQNKLYELIDDLHYIHEHKLLVINRLLGRVYAHGLGVTPSFPIAERYFLAAIPDKSIDGIAELANFKLESLSSALSQDEKIIKLIEYLENAKSYLPAANVQQVIYYYEGYLALMNNDRVAALAYLRKANRFHSAKVALGTLHSNADDFESARSYYEEILRLGDTSIADEMLEFLLRRYPLEESIKIIIDIAPNAVVEIAARVSDYLRQNHPMEEICEDASDVWWLQLAAQTGCNASLQALQAIDAKEHSYVACALGIIYEFGILNSDAVEANHDKAEYYFHLARKQSVLDIEIYLLFGIGAGTITHETITLLRQQANAQPVWHNTSKSHPPQRA